MGYRFPTGMEFQQRFLSIRYLVGIMGNSGRLSKLAQQQRVLRHKSDRQYMDWPTSERRSSLCLSKSSQLDTEQQLGSQLGNSCLLGMLLLAKSLD